MDSRNQLHINSSGYPISNIVEEISDDEDDFDSDILCSDLPCYGLHSRTQKVTVRAPAISKYFGSKKPMCAELVGSTAADSTRKNGNETKDHGSILNAHIICATPEKWLSATENPLMGTTLQDSIELLLIDECHMVGTSRGAFLELAVASVRRGNKNVRVIATSATISNISDISAWLSPNVSTLDDPNLSAPAKTCIFGPEYRPVQLSKIVLGYDIHMNYFQFQRNLDYRLPAIINQHGPVVLTSAFTNRLLNGLSASDRTRVEELFTKGSDVSVGSTSTLGMGINLPAYMVIVKGTKGYIENGYKEYSTLDILQFIGRAGRPPFGKDAKAIILTGRNMVNTYQSLVSGKETLESR
ncbi:ATP-dependent DNA helicase MER3 [Coemansia sp. RSA 1646]|nr:ATP-dependent DNA helicase MER3 [Coemansia sp. RSA 1646]